MLILLAIVIELLGCFFGDLGPATRWSIAVPAALVIVIGVKMRRSPPSPLVHQRLSHLALCCAFWIYGATWFTARTWWMMWALVVLSIALAVGVVFSSRNAVRPT